MREGCLLIVTAHRPVRSPSRCGRNCTWYGEGEVRSTVSVNRETLLVLSKDDLVPWSGPERRRSARWPRASRHWRQGLTPRRRPRAPQARHPRQGRRPIRPKTPRIGRLCVSRALAEHLDRVIEATLAASPPCAHALGPAKHTDIHADSHIELPHQPGRRPYQPPSRCPPLLSQARRCTASVVTMFLGGAASRVWASGSR